MVTPANRAGSLTSETPWWCTERITSPSQLQATSDRGHRVGVLADPPTGLDAGPLGQHCRTAATGQIADPDRSPAVQLGPHPAAHAADLDDTLPLAPTTSSARTSEPSRPSSLEADATASTHLGPPVLQTSDIGKLCEAPGAVLAPWPPLPTQHPTLHDGEPESGILLVSGDQAHGGPSGRVPAGLERGVTASRLPLACDAVCSASEDAVVDALELFDPLIGEGEE